MLSSLFSLSSQASVDPGTEPSGRPLTSEDFLQEARALHLRAVASQPAPHTCPSCHSSLWHDDGDGLSSCRVCGFVEAIQSIGERDLRDGQDGNIVVERVGRAIVSTQGRRMREILRDGARAGAETEKRERQGARREVVVALKDDAVKEVYRDAVVRIAGQAAVELGDPAVVQGIDAVCERYRAASLASFRPAFGDAVALLLIAARLARSMTQAYTLLARVQSGAIDIASSPHVARADRQASEAIRARGFAGVGVITRNAPFITHGIVMLGPEGLTRKAQELAEVLGVTLPPVNAGLALRSAIARMGLEDDFAHSVRAAGLRALQADVRAGMGAEKLKLLDSEAGVLAAMIVGVKASVGVHPGDPNQWANVTGLRRDCLVCCRHPQPFVSDLRNPDTVQLSELPAMAELLTAGRGKPLGGLGDLLAGRAKELDRAPEDLSVLTGRAPGWCVCGRTIDIRGWHVAYDRPQYRTFPNGEVYPATVRVRGGGGRQDALIDFVANMFGWPRRMLAKIVRIIDAELVLIASGKKTGFDQVNPLLNVQRYEKLRAQMSEGTGASAPTVKLETQWQRTVQRLVLLSNKRKREEEEEEEEEEDGEEDEEEDDEEEEELAGDDEDSDDKKRTPIDRQPPLSDNTPHPGFVDRTEYLFVPASSKRTRGRALDPFGRQRLISLTKTYLRTLRVLSRYTHTLALSVGRGHAPPEMPSPLADAVFRAFSALIRHDHRVTWRHLPNTQRTSIIQTIARISRKLMEKADASDLPAGQEDEDEDDDDDDKTEENLA